MIFFYVVFSVQIPSDVATDALVAFEALSLMSTEFGVTDYLHGHQPVFTAVCPAEDGKGTSTSLSVRFPTRAGSEGPLVLNLSAWPTAESAEIAVMSNKLSELQQNHQLSAHEVWTVLNIKGALRGFQVDMEYRLKVVKMRLYCFFMLVHSKVPPDAIQEYMRSGSRFLQDLIDLSDLSSEASSELGMQHPAALAYLSLENVLGLLENKLRRRSSFVVQSNILSLLGLSSGPIVAISGRSEGAWTSIVMAACAAAPLLFNCTYSGAASAPSSPATSPSSKLAVAASPSHLTIPQKDNEISSLAKFIRIGMELFILSLTQRDVTHVVSDMPLISTIVGVIQGAVPHMERIFSERKTRPTSAPNSSYEVHLFLVVAKALYCLELVTDRTEYLGAFRESEGISTLTRVVQLFAEAASGVDTVDDKFAFMDPAARNALESSLSSICVVIQKSRHTVVLQGNTADTGVRIVYESFFGDLCTKAFTSPFQGNETIWAQLVTLIKEAIELDPSYLSHFLASSYADVLLKVLQIPFGAAFPTAVFAPKASTNLEGILVPLARLAGAVSITPEGRAYVTRARLVHFILEAMVQPCCMLPTGKDIETARVCKLGKLIGQLMSDHEELRTPLRDMIKKRLIAFSKEAADSWRSLDAVDTVHLSSARVQALQKLSDLCTFVENTFAERRVRHDDSVREILCQPVLEGLLAAFPATLSPPRQLLAQLALRHVQTAPHYGHSASAKAITSLLKIAVSQVSHSAAMITLVSRELELHLIAVNTACHTLAGSVGAKSANVQLLGVLDRFQHRCVIDPAFEQVGAEESNAAFKFLTSVLSIEWLSILLAQAIRTDQRVQTSRISSSYKETLKRLLAFHKTSLLEVCRFSSSKWSPKPLSEARFKKTLPDALCRCDSLEDAEFIPRIPIAYQLRVAGNGGALVREGIEIEGSRVVLVADVGCELTGFERRGNAAGVIRYRTAHGWISEFRRDHQKNPIVELLSLSVLSPEDVAQERARRAELKTDAEKLVHAAVEALTLRESAFVCLTKVNAALRQVSIYLSRSMYQQESYSYRGQQPSVSANAPILAGVLSKGVKSFFSFARNCIDASALPESHREQKKSLSSSNLSAPGSVDDLTAAMDGLNASASSGGSTSVKKKRGGKTEATTDEDARPAGIEIDTSTLCLFYGAAVKHIVLPVLEDKNGCLNILLLRTMCNDGVIQQIVDAFSIALLVMRAAVDARSEEAPELSAVGQCALHSLFSFQTVFERLVSRELFARSIAVLNPTGAAVANQLTDETGPYQAHELVFQVVSTIQAAVLPLLEAKVLRNFPGHIQYDWFSMIGELVNNLNTALPPPAVTRTSYSRSDSSAPQSPSLARMPRGLAGAQISIGADGRPFLTPQPAAASAPSPVRTFVPDPLMVDMLAEMGFERDHIVSTITALRTTNMDTITQYMFNNPWTPPPAAAPATAASEATTTANAAEATTPVDFVASNAVAPPVADLPPAPAASNATPALQLPPPPPNALGLASSPGALPNLVPDLDDASSAESSPVAAAAAASAADGPASTPPSSQTSSANDALQQAFSDMGESVRAAAAQHSVSTDRFRGAMDLLFESASTSPRLNRLLAEEMSTPMANADQQLGRLARPPSTGSPRPPGLTVADTDKEARDFTSQGERMKTWATELCALIVPNFLEVALCYEDVCQWDKKENHILIPLMVELLVKLNNGEVVPRTLPYGEILSAMMNCLEEESLKLCAPDPQAPQVPRIHGLLFFVTQFLLEPSVRKVLVEGRHLTRSSGTHMASVLTMMLNKVVSQPAMHWPKWISPAMMLLYELLSLPGTAADRRKPGRNATRLGMWDEKDEGEDLDEHKEESADGVNNLQVKGAFNSKGSFLNQVFLLTNSCRDEIFQLIVSLITTSLSSKTLSADAQQGSLIVLLSLLSNQKNVTAFVDADGVCGVLSLIERDPSPESRAGQAKLLTLIVQRCMETEVELQQMFEEHIRGMFRGNTAEDKCLAFTAFIQALTPDLLRSPDDFWQACKHTVKIIKVPSSTRKSERGVMESKSEIKVRLLDSEQLAEAQMRRTKTTDVDDRAYNTLRCVLQYVVQIAHRNKDNDNSTESCSAATSAQVSVSGALNAVSDSILSLRRAPMLAARLLKADTETIGLHAGENFVDFLLTTYFTEGLAAHSENALARVPTNADLAACSRVLVALCAFKGASRILTLNSILKSLHGQVVSLIPVCAAAPASSDSEATRQAEIKRVLLLSRLASLIGIIIRASKTPSKEASSAKGQGVSVDTLHYLIEHGRILKVLTQALCGLPVHLQVSVGAVSAILDLMELITRPKIQAHLDKLVHAPVSGEKSNGGAARADDAPRTSSLASIDGDAIISSEHGADEFFAMGAEDSSYSRGGGPPQLHGSSILEGLQAQLAHLSHSHSGDPHDEQAEESDDSDDSGDEDEDQDEDQDDDEHGEEGEEGDEDDGEEDEDDEEEGSDESDEEDEDGEEEDEEESEDDEDHDGGDGGNGDGNAHSILPTFPPHGVVAPGETGGVDVDDGDEDLFGGASSNMLQQLVDEMTGGEDAYVNIDNSFRTSLDRQQQRMLLLQETDVLLGDVDAPDLNLRGNAFVTPPMHANGADIQFMVNGMSVNDPLDIASLFRRMTAGELGHATAGRRSTAAGDVGQASGMSELLPQGIAAALEVAPTFLGHPLLGAEQFQPRGPAGLTAATPLLPQVPLGRPSMATAAFARRHALSGMGGLSGFGVSTGPGVRGMQPMQFPDGSDILGSHLDLRMYDGSDPTMPAVWPRGVIGGSVPESASSRRPVAASQALPAASTDMAQLVLQQLEDNLIEGLELIEESADEVSQSSFTETSRGDGVQTIEGAFSYSEQSNTALQDPNPRTAGEADSRLGHPIPPIIEIDSPGHEGNEELSVITLPQEDPNAPEVDESVAQQNSVAAQSPSVRTPVQFETSAEDAAESSAAVSASTAPVVNVSASPTPAPADAIVGIAFDSLLSSLSGMTLAPPTSPAAAPSADTAIPQRAAEETGGQAVEDDGGQSSVHSAEEAASSLEVTEEVAAEDEVDADAGSNEESAESGSRLACPPGYDSEVFYSLPEEMQLEIIEQSRGETGDQSGSETVDETRALIEAAGLDYDAIASLPESIRQEVLDQARREQQATTGASGATGSGATSGSGGGGGAQDIDNATFLASLTLELRAEVLLTADADFLATLPPNLIAEAQMIREQAASSWQRRELMSRMGTRESSSAAANAQAAAAANAVAAAVAGGSGIGLGAPGEFYGDEDDDDDEDEQDEEGDSDLDALQLMPRRRDGFQVANYGGYGGSSSNRTGTGRAKPERPKTGLMRVPGSNSWRMKIPRYLVVGVLKMMLNAPKQPTRGNISFEILQNVSTDLRSKDVNLKLLLGLVAEQRDLLVDSLKQLCGAEASLNVLMDRNMQTLFSDAVAKPSLVSTRSNASAEVRLDINSLGAQRIISVLGHLISSNSAFVYLLLTERDAKFFIADEETVAKLQASPQPVTSAAELLTVTEGSAEHPGLSSDDDKGPAPDDKAAVEVNAKPAAVAVKKARTALSSNSLLELLITLFAKPAYTNSVNELDALARLLSAVTAPLDSLPDEAVADADASAASSQAVIPKEVAAKDAKQHMVTLAVPRVILSREALGHLCDVLLNDLCSKRVLSNVTSTISRLSKIYQNHSLLLELIVDVIVDLADQSQYKLDTLTETLQQVRSKYLATNKPLPKPKAATDSPARVKVVSLKMSADEVSSPAKGSHATAATSALPTSLLPLGESGSKQHERLLRVVQTLHSMSEKTNRQLSDVTPTEQLSELWSGLDKVLQQLRHYLADVDEDENSEKETGESIRPQSTLTSILNRLLPAVEAFFLIHASDFLAEKPRSSVTGGEKSAASTEVSAAKAAVDGNQLSPPAPADATPAPATASGTNELIPLSSMPGHSYRTSPAYLRSNVSLFAAEAGPAGAGALDEGTPLQNSRSLRKQPSLTSMTSRVGSVLSSRGHRLLQFVQSNKGLLNLIVKSNPALLDGSLSAFVRITQLRACLKFDNKRKYFFTALKRSTQAVSRRGVHLQIRRNQVFEDSFHQLRVRTAEEMRGRLQVNFYGEEGVDAGGLSREWYVILAREIFNPNYALFTAAADGATFQPNPLSMINTNHLDYFKFVGRLIGKAICDGQLLDAHFTRYVQYLITLNAIATIKTSMQRG